MKREIFPDAVNIALFRINSLNKNKNKVYAYYKNSDHPLTTGFLIRPIKKGICEYSIFYSLLSLDFYLFLNESEEIYSYLENNGALNHMDNFFNKSTIENIKKYLVTL